MKFANKIGVAATVVAIVIAIALLLNNDNGRMFQGGIVFQLGAGVGFLYAGVRGSRWWFTAPLGVVLFWIVVAHIPALWN